MIEEQNREIIRQLYQEVSASKGLDSRQGRIGRRFTQYTATTKPFTLKTFKSFFSQVSQAFPDYELKLENIIVKGDRVMTRYSICGTHKGEFLGMSPTNERLKVSGIDIFRLDNGKVVEHWDAAHQVSAISQAETNPAFSASTRRPLVTGQTAGEQFSLSH